MAVRNRRAAAVCAYCGATNATERDHVPPQGLFARPGPANLIRVPVCTTCHRPTSTDDEYFRLALTARADVDDHPDVAGGVLDGALRSLGRPPAEGFARGFMRSVQIVRLRSPAGLHLGEAGSNQPDAARLMAVVERIVRGLFFHHTEQVLGPAVAIQSLEDTLSDLSRLSPEDRRALEDTARGVAASEWRQVGRVFTYAFWRAPDDPETSAWLLRFYGVVTFLSLTAPRDRTARL